MDLYNDLMVQTKALEVAVKQLRKSGSDYAKAYTLCSDLARGNREVARLKFEEISKEAIYKANLESINATKLRIRVIENQIEKEWSNTNG